MVGIPERERRCPFEKGQRTVPQSLGKEIHSPVFLLLQQQVVPNLFWPDVGRRTWILGRIVTFIAKMLLHSWGFPAGTVVIFLYEQPGDSFPPRWNFFLSDGRRWKTTVNPQRGIELGYWREI